MKSRTARRITALAPIVVLACLVSACGSGAPEATAPSASALAAVSGDQGESMATEDSYPLPDCTGQDPQVCSYDGFDPTVDGFSFANWGATGELDATGMVALFGAKAVCARQTSKGCVLYPAAKQWAEQVNEAMVGGHCEGMAVMAARLFRGDAQLADLDPAAQATFDLAFEDPDVEDAIDLWWATQLLAPVQEAYMAFHDYQPSEIAAELAVGLQNGEGYTMGIYSPDGAHAITPFAVTQEGDDIAVSVYDNNFPGTVQRIMIDPVAERWSYAMGSTNPDAPTGGWEGGIGTIELTPMDSRALPAAAPFDDTATKGVVRGNAATAHLLVTSPDPASRVGFDLTVDGTTYDTTEPGVDLPAGVMARSTLGASFAGKGMAISVDRTIVKSFSAAPRIRGAATATPVTMSIDAVGSPRVTLRATAAESSPADNSFTVSRNGRLAVAAAGPDAEVNVANGLNSVDFSLPDDVDMTVDPGDDGVADIAYVDEDGNIVGEYAIDDETEDGSVIEGSAEFDEGSGAFDVTEEQAVAEELDEDSLAVLVDDFSGADSGEADSADDSGGAAKAPDDSGADQGADAGGDAGVDESDPGADAGDEGVSDGSAADDAGVDDGGDPGSDSGGDPEVDAGDVAPDESGE